VGVKKIVGKIQKDRYTVVPTKAYMKNNKLKVQIALAKGKSDFDKRKDLKKESIKKEEQAFFKHKIKGL